MKRGLGLCPQLLNRDHYRVAKQAGATQIVSQLSDYFRPGSLSTASDEVWGRTKIQPARLLAGCLA